MLTGFAVGFCMLDVLFTFLAISCYISMTKEAWKHLIEYKPWILEKDRPKQHLPFYKKIRGICKIIMFFIPVLNAGLFIAMMALPEVIYSLIYDSLNETYG